MRMTVCPMFIFNPFYLCFCSFHPLGFAPPFPPFRPPSYLLIFLVGCWLGRVYPSDGPYPLDEALRVEGSLGVRPV